MKKQLGFIVFLITSTLTVCADETLTELFTVVEAEFGKELVDQEFKSLPVLCDKGYRQWDNAASISFENSLRQKSISRLEDEKPHPFNTSPLAGYGKDFCDKNAELWKSRKVEAEYMNKALEDCKKLMKFLEDFNNKSDDVMVKKIQSAHLIIDAQFRNLTRSYLSYLKSEKSTATKSQSSYGTGYLWAWGASGARKACRFYNGEYVFDTSRPFDEQQGLYQHFLAAAFGDDEFEKGKWGLIKGLLGSEDSEERQQQLKKLAPEILHCITEYKPL